MGEIDDAIERRPGELHPPAAEDPQGPDRLSAPAVGQREAVAREIGVTSDSVNRYRRGARKHARADGAAKIEDVVRARWQPQVRRRRQQQAATSGGITVETRVRFGYTAPVGTTDDGRFRRLTVHLPPTYARRLFAARDAGASDQEMRCHMGRLVVTDDAPGRFR